MNTPRTDAAERKAHGVPDGFDLLPNLYVPGDFARQLETELIAMTALADQMAEALERQLGFPNCSRAKVLSTEALAAYEKHKKQTP